MGGDTFKKSVISTTGGGCVKLFHPCAPTREATRTHLSPPPSHTSQPPAETTDNPSPGRGFRGSPTEAIPRQACSHPRLTGRQAACVCPPPPLYTPRPCVGMEAEGPLASHPPPAGQRRTAGSGEGDNSEHLLPDRLLSTRHPQPFHRQKKKKQKKSNGATERPSQPRRSSPSSLLILLRPALAPPLPSCPAPLARAFPSRDASPTNTISLPPATLRPAFAPVEAGRGVTWRRPPRFSLAGMRDRPGKGAASEGRGGKGRGARARLW